MKNLLSPLLCFVVLLMLIACGGKTENHNTITVSAGDSGRYKNFLEEAARSYEALHPGTKVKVETFSKMPVTRTVQTAEGVQTVTEETVLTTFAPDYLRRVSTQMNSGKGADLYAVDVLPLDKWVESGYIENLEPLMANDPDFHQEDYRTNILEAVKFRNGAWYLPLDYYLWFYTYDSTLVPADMCETFGVNRALTMTDLLDMGEIIYNGKNKLFNINIQGLTEQILTENWHVYVDREKKQAHFIDGGFAKLLDAMTSYESKEYILPKIRNPELESNRYFFKQYTNLGLLAYFAANAMYRGSSNADDGIACTAAYGNNRVVFNHNLGFAMNASSKNKELAWDFLKFLLSKDMQLSTNHTQRVWQLGLPINNEARFEKAELLFFEDGIINDQKKQALSDYRATVEALSDHINSYFDIDLPIFMLMLEPLSYWLDGSRTSAEVTALIQNKVDIYLNE